ncbi:MAG: hypothetical protein EBT22_00190 [Chloroflexi bacterium]|nr:hypothetical protein [Chloroflexota bacterium]
MRNLDAFGIGVGIVSLANLPVRTHGVKDGGRWRRGDLEGTCGHLARVACVIGGLRGQAVGAGTEVRSTGRGEAEPEGRGSGKDLFEDGNGWSGIDPVQAELHGAEWFGATGHGYVESA